MAGGGASRTRRVRRRGRAARSLLRFLAKERAERRFGPGIERVLVLPVVRRVRPRPGAVTCTLAYWRTANLYVGGLLEFVNVLGYGRTLRELRKNVRNAYRTLKAASGLRRRVEQQTRPLDVW